MKKQPGTLFNQIGAEEKSNLTAVVNETLATGVKTKTFTVADLWSIQRQGRVRGIRTFSL